MVLRNFLWNNKAGKPVYGNKIPTYGDCMDKGRQILVLINENDVEVWRAHQDIWPTIGCWRDRFTAYSYAMNGWDTLVGGTIQDQQDYLTTAHAEDGRDRDRFWVSQTILDYAAYAPDGKSRNWYGTQRLNPAFVTAFDKWWRGKSATDTPALVKQSPRPRSPLAHGRATGRRGPTAWL